MPHKRRKFVRKFATLVSLKVPSGTVYVLCVPCSCRTRRGSTVLYTFAKGGGEIGPELRTTLESVITDLERDIDQRDLEGQQEEEEEEQQRQEGEEEEDRGRRRKEEEEGARREAHNGVLAVSNVRWAWPSRNDTLVVFVGCCRCLSDSSSISTWCTTVLYVRMFPTTNDGMQKRKHSRNTHTLHARSLHVLALTCMLSRCLVTKISATELSRRFIKSALLVGSLQMSSSREESVGSSSAAAAAVRLRLPHEFKGRPSSLPPEPPPTEPAAENRMDLPELRLDGPPPKDRFMQQQQQRRMQHQVTHRGGGGAKQLGSPS